MRREASERSEPTLASVASAAAAVRQCNRHNPTAPPRLRTLRCTAASVPRLCYSGRAKALRCSQPERSSPGLCLSARHVVPQPAGCDGASPRSLRGGVRIGRTQTKQKMAHATVGSKAGTQRAALGLRLLCTLLTSPCLSPVCLHSCRLILPPALLTSSCSSWTSCDGG